MSASRTRAFVDLHCHTSASFDSLSSPAAVVRAAAVRGLTHLAITDHDRIDGALEARELARSLAPALTVLIGEEVKSRDGDLIGVFLREAIPPGLSAAETITAIHDQGGLVGIPHPFDGSRGGSLSRAGGAAAVENLEALATTVDWIEAWNARVMIGNGNHRAAELAVAAGVPGIAASDAHTTMEIGIAMTVLPGDPSTGDPSTADGLREALAGPLELVMGRASAYARLVTPAAKLIQRRRGNGRVRPTAGLGLQGGGR